MFFKKKKEPEIPANTQTANPAAADAEISGEIIAVITAAIAAFTAGQTPGSNLIIRKISRVHGEKLSWSNAGLMECIDSRRF
jgi:hypothetical protein